METRQQPLLLFEKKWRTGVTMLFAAYIGSKIHKSIFLVPAFFKQHFAINFLFILCPNILKYNHSLTKNKVNKRNHFKIVFKSFVFVTWLFVLILMFELKNNKGINRNKSSHWLVQVIIGVLFYCFSFPLPRICWRQTRKTTVLKSARIQRKSPRSAERKSHYSS